MDKIINDLSILYLNKNFNSFKDINSLFIQYIEIKNQLTDLFDKYQKNQTDEYLKEYCKIMDSYIN